MESTLKNQIILAAIGAAGPVDGDWLPRVTDLASQITVMTSEESSLAKHIDSVADAKVFRGHILGVVKEQSSTRGVVTLKGTGPVQIDTKTKLPVIRKDATTGLELPVGQEQVRTERMDGALGLAMGRRVRGLIGHTVILWVKVEEYNGGQGKVRVLMHIEDQGISTDADAAAALMAEEQRSALRAA